MHKFRRTLGASTLRHDKVVNLAGQDIGRIEELMIDVTTGRVAYAVLSFGGFLGIGSKLFALPWSALTGEEALRRQRDARVAREDAGVRQGLLAGSQRSGVRDRRVPAVGGDPVLDLR